MKISLTALGLVALAWLLRHQEASEFIALSYVTFCAAIPVGLWGAVSAYRSRTMHPEDRIAAIVMGALPVAITLFIVVAVYFAARGGAFD